MMTTEDTLIEFPCDFQIKVIGSNNEQFIQGIIRIAKTHFPALNEASIHIQPSREQTYTAIRLTVHAQDKASLDALYMALNKHPDIKMVL